MDNRIVFHFNKAHLTDSNIPMWVLKYRGQTLYIDHLESNIGFKTKETPNNEHTKGSLLFRGNLEIQDIDSKKTAFIT